jgi:hypothetical protein
MVTKLEEENCSQEVVHNQIIIERERDKLLAEVNQNFDAVINHHHNVVHVLLWLQQW